MKILIAEDDATSRLLLQTTLKQWGHEVIATTDGQQAYDALLAEDAPRLAIFDWMMPQLDGIEVCRKAREDAQLEHLYVIMLTTRDTKDDIAEALQAGADDYLNKPFDRKEMQARIQVGKARTRPADCADGPSARLGGIDQTREAPARAFADLFLL